jgi:hypothetical protein
MTTVDYRFGLTLSCHVCHLASDVAVLPSRHVARSHLAPPTNLLPRYDHVASIVLLAFLTPLLVRHMQEQQTAALYFVCVTVCVCFLILHVDSFVGGRKKVCFIDH